MFYVKDFDLISIFSAIELQALKVSPTLMPADSALLPSSTAMTSKKPVPSLFLPSMSYFSSTVIPSGNLH